MNLNILLEDSEFNQEKLLVLEFIIETFYKTNNNNDRAIANQYLNEFKMKENSWTFCDKILTSSNNLLTKIYAVSILDDLVRTRFNLLLPEQKEIIRNFIVDILIKTVSSQSVIQGTPDQINSFINKLNTVVVDIAKSEWPYTWKTFLSEICISSKSSQELCENNLKIILALK